MNEPSKKRQPKPRNVIEWRERVAQRLDQVIGQGTRQRYHELVIDIGGLGIVGQDKTDGWRRLDPVAVANGIAAEEVGQRVIDEPTPRQPGEPVPFEVDAEWKAKMETALKCELRVSAPYHSDTMGAKQ